MLITLPDWWSVVLNCLYAVMLIAIAIHIIFGAIFKIGNKNDKIVDISLFNCVIAVVIFFFLIIERSMTPYNYFDAKYRDEVKANIDNGYICSVDDTVIDSEFAKQIVDGIYDLNNCYIWTNDNEKKIVLHQEGVLEQFKRPNCPDGYRDRIQLSLLDRLKISNSIPRQLTGMHIIGVCLVISGCGLIISAGRKCLIIDPYSNSSGKDALKIFGFGLGGFASIIISFFVFISASMQLNI